MCCTATSRPVAIKLFSNKKTKENSLLGVLQLRDEEWVGEITV